MRENTVLKFEAENPMMAQPESQGYTFGDVAYWVLTFIRVSVITALRSAPDVRARETQLLEKATASFDRVVKERVQWR